MAGTLIPNRISFSVNVGGSAGYTSPNLLAVLADGTTLAEALRRPSENLAFGIRVDTVLNPAHSLRVSLDGKSGETRNLGVGGFNLPTRAFKSNSDAYFLRLAEGGPVEKRMYSESRLQLLWSSSRSQSAIETPLVQVLDAFASGGAQVKGGLRTVELEAASDLDYVRGRHSWRVGGLVEGGRYRSDDMANYLGTYVFSSVSAFNAGRPSVYTRRIGDPNITYSAWEAGFYLQDDWRLSRSVLVSPGLRGGVQTLTGDQFNLSPRISLGWAPLGNGTLMLRAAYGYLYDWVPGAVFKQSQLYDGVRLKDLNVTNPSYPNPPSAGPTSVSNKYLWSDDLALPTSHRLNLGVDRQLSARMRTSLAYTFGWGRGLLRGRNLNPAINGVKVDPSFANVVAIAQDAEARSQSLNVGWNLAKPAWRRSTFGVNYTWNRAEGDTTGAFSLPANGDSLETEWGPTRAAHTASANMLVQPIPDLSLSLNTSIGSGTP